MKHTPGPWKYVVEKETYRDPQTGGLLEQRFDLIRAGEFSTTIASVYGIGNGPLIAAAPEMLEALEAIEPKLDQIEMYGGFEAVRKVQEVLAKIRGTK